MTLDVLGSWHIYNNGTEYRLFKIFHDNISFTFWKSFYYHNSMCRNKFWYFILYQSFKIVKNSIHKLKWFDNTFFFCKICNMQKTTPVVPVYLYIQMQWPGCWTVRHCDGLWSWHPLKESSPAYRPETGLSLWLQCRKDHNLISLQDSYTKHLPPSKEFINTRW